MNKSTAPTRMSRFYAAVLVLIVLLVIYWYFSSGSSSSYALATLTDLPRSSLFAYANISSQLHSNAAQGILYVPPADHPAHFASINSAAVRGNHRHTDTENSISHEVIVLLQGRFQFRIGHGETNRFEDHTFDVANIGIVALQFTADKCHALKNLGKDTGWFASYYVKSKVLFKPASIDRKGCTQMFLA